MRLFTLAVLCLAVAVAATETAPPAFEQPEYAKSIEVTDNAADAFEAPKQDKDDDEFIVKHPADMRFQEQHTAAAAPTPITAGADQMRFRSKDQFIGKVLKHVGGAIKSMVTGASKKRRPEDVEDCTACRFAWLSVEQKVGNSQVEENIYDAFTSACIEMQKAPIFYPACEDMFDDVYGMIGDYMDGYTVNQMCEGAKLCR